MTRGGERFSPKGAYHFITTLLLSTKDRLKQSKAYKLEVRKILSQPNSFLCIKKQYFLAAFFSVTLRKHIQSNLTLVNHEYLVYIQ